MTNRYPCKTIPGSPLQVMLGILLKKVWLVDEAEDNFLADIRLTMRWIDPHLKLCRCHGAGRQIETQRLDALEGVKLWLPDLHIYELREDEELLSAGKSGLERGEEASDVSLSSAGDDQASEVYKVQSKNVYDFERILFFKLGPLSEALGSGLLG